MGNPDTEVVEAYLEMRRQGVGERTAARLLESTQREIAEWFELNPDWKLKLEDALLERIELVEQKVWEAGQGGDMNAAKTVLESHMPTEWIKPSQEMILKVQQDVDGIDIESLRERLEAAQRQKELRTKSIEVKEIEETTE